MYEGYCNGAIMKPITDEIKYYIQYGIEERDWEFKPALSWSKDQRKEKFEIIKTTIALSNNINGGIILFGISQRRDRSEGTKFDRTGLSTAQYNSFDNNDDDIGRFFIGKTNHELRFELLGGIVSIANEDKKFIALKVYESQTAIPIVCAVDHDDRDPRCRLKKGALYIRSSAKPVESREIRTNEEWDELILRLLERKEKIIHRDLMALLSNVTISKKKQIILKLSTKNESEKYEKYLKRDKL